MSRTVFVTALALAVALWAGCNERDRRGTLPATDAGGGASDGSMPGTDGATDGAVPGTDGALPGNDGAPPGDDAGVPPGTDGGSGMQSDCAPACMAMAGAYCCNTCGCSGGTVRCDPVCDAPYEWDCEIRCCFNYSTFECACPAGTTWDSGVYCCKDSSGTCVYPAD